MAFNDKVTRDMSRPTVAPTGNERTFDSSEIIVSKTDLAGKITYINEIFERISGFSREEVMGEPHNIIRHPEMPRCIFDLAWETLKQGQEIFAYVVNLCKNGDHYWVLAHMVPSYNPKGEVVGFHSNRRVPRPDNVNLLKGLYSELLKIEAQSDPKQGMTNARTYIDDFLASKNVGYDEFIFSLSR